MPGHVPLAGSARSRQRQAHRVGDVDPAARVDLTVALTAPALPEPDVASVLTREQIESSYGVDPATVAAVTETLRSFGLSVDARAGIGRSLRVSGTAAQVEAAFKPGLGIYRSDEQGEFQGREGELQIPAELDGLVVGVFGLDSRRVARRRMSATSATAEPLTPAQIASHYDFPAADGGGRTVAIAEFGGGYFASDLTVFCEQQGTPVPSVTTIGVNGTKVLTLQEIEQLPSSQQTEQLDDSVEVNMDVQIVAGLSPGTKILVYFSSFDEQGWVDLIDEVVDGTPDEALTLSVSWGLAEDDPDWSSGALQAIDERLQAAAALGITVCAAAGDDGSADQETDGRAHVDFPASSPHVLAVGGTMLDGDTDVVWWQSPGERTSSGGGATGGGVSDIFPRPSWQTVDIASVNPGSIAGRIVPDIAALAGPPYYELIFMGQDQPNGGTSAATPTWASLLALMASAQTPWKPAFLSPLLYAGASATAEPVGELGCTDVTSGNNISSTLGKGYSAGPGFDAVSGWGVPNGAALLAALNAAAQQRPVL